jgi:TolA-binding protein
MKEKSDSIQKLKSSVASILRKKNATAAELADAKKMIDEMNGKVEELYAEIDKLKNENQQLTADKTQLTTEKAQIAAQKDTIQQNLEKTTAEKQHVEDVASTLHASAINVEAIDVKRSGKEKETTTAKKADLIRVTFKLDENRIAPSGQKEIYICVTNPDGTPISRGTVVTTREDGDKQYTDKVVVNYQQGKVLPVSFDWKNGDNKLQTGNYKIEIYHNGYKIGEGSTTLKKGGLFARS